MSVEGAYGMTTLSLPSERERGGRKQEFELLASE